MASTPQKPRVMVLNPCYLPGFRGGGPARSLANLVKALGADIDFRIVTLDRDRESDPPYPSVRPGIWQTGVGAEVLYLSRTAVSVRRLVQEIKAVSPHVIYLQGFFDPVFTIRVLLARRIGLFSGVPLLLAPQGVFSPGALRLKFLKKATYIRLAQAVGLYRNLTWQASSEMERREILRTMTTVETDRVKVVADLTDGIAFAPRGQVARPPGGPLRLCFLSRISPKKNLDFALRVLSGVRAPVEFTIFGPAESASYWAECQNLIAMLPDNVRATYGGEVHPAEVRRTLAEHDMLFLPTRGENFGHVIHEALSAGVPALISDQTPWSDLEANGAGWNIALEAPSEFVRTIEAASGTLPDQREAFTLRAMAYAAMRADRQASIERTHALFRGLLPR